MTESLVVNTNNSTPQFDSLPMCVAETFRTGLIDSGIIIKVAIPYSANVHRHVPANTLQRWQPLELPGSNRQPFFGILIDPYLNHDLNGPFSPLIYPDSSWVTVNVDLTAHPYGLEHPLVRMMNTFAAWRGTLNYLITVTSSMIVQGELSVIRGKWVGNGPYKWKYPQLEFDEVDNNQIINLTSERRVMKSVSYNANVNFTNMMHYWQAMAPIDITNVKPMHAARNYLFVRPNTDITTFSPEGGTLSFKIFYEPGEDFEFLYPSLPVRMDRFRSISVVDKRFPFSIRETLIVSQRQIINGLVTVTNMFVEDSKYEQTLEITPSFATVTRTFTTPYNVGFIDIHSYTASLSPRWQAITGYTYGLSSPGSANFVVSAIIDGVTTALLTKSMADMVLGEELLSIGFNTYPYNAIEPPFYYP